MAKRMVIDASVAAKWFIRDEREQDIDLAVGILQSFLSNQLELHAPRIFTYEVCGLLTKACQTPDATTRNPRLGKKLAVDCVRAFFALPVRISDPSEEEGVESLEMAVEFSKKHYDMAYLRLAQRLQCQWCTDDRKVLEAYPSGYPIGSILSLHTLRGTGPS